MDRTELLDLEHAGWRALGTGGDPAAFYGGVLADELLMLLPGGMVIADRDEAIQAMSGASWDSYELADERVLELTEQSAVVAYRATASRAGTRYEALFNSTYIREAGGWKLALHQQTPV